VAKLTFSQIWEAVKALTPGQQRRLRKLLGALRFMSQPLSPEDEAALLLLKDGVIRRVPRPATEADSKSFQEYKPIQVEGKPISESIVEDRR
jgi:hypothetical protein